MLDICDVYVVFIKRIICKYLIFTFVKTRNANGETGFFLDNTHGEVLCIETSPAFLATADYLNAVWKFILKHIASHLYLLSPITPKMAKI